MPNEEYQQLFVLDAETLRARLEARVGPTLRKRFAALADDELRALIFDLGGHDLAELIAAYRECDAHPDQPSVVFAYTIKGWGSAQRRQRAQPLGAAARRTRSTRFARRSGSISRPSGTASTPDSPAGRLVRRVSAVS